MSKAYYAACDLGAESGRVMLGTIGDGELRIEEIHRFPNELIYVNGSIRWDLLRIFEQLKIGLAQIAKRGISLRSLSVDSWGVDYVLIGGGQPMLSQPRNYRDPRNRKYADKLHEQLSPKEIFEYTGLECMPINTIYQLYADMHESPGLLDLAETFLNVGDYMNYLFSGVVAAERSLASTTQLYCPVEHDWAWDLIDRVGLQRDLFPELIDSGTQLGPLLPEVAEQTGLDEVQVVATCSHDTGAAVAAVPAAEDSSWAFLSSGTWSLIGLELEHPPLNDEVRHASFTNEIGYGRTVRFLKNIVGLWIVQECRRHWLSEGEEFGYAALTALAAESEPLQSLINPDDERFFAPGDMPEKVRSYCRETGQTEPHSHGELVRTVLESLALSYSRCVHSMERLAEVKIETLHILGGGSKNELLNQFAANATGLEILAGPDEATAMGNILVQALADGKLGSIWEARQFVRTSTQTASYIPQDRDTWAEASRRFEELLNRS